MHKIAFAPLLCGCVAMAGGLIPGLLDGLIRGIEEFSRNFGLSGPTFLRPDAAVSKRQSQGMVVVGAAFLIFGAYASFG